ncbi:alpha-(1,3)-fucosyltransferase C-like, partial [Littorina saxatilis]
MVYLMMSALRRVNAEGEEFMRCPEKRCRITRDRGELRNSDAVIFSSRGLWNTFLPVYTMPTWRHPHQVWIISEMEAPPETILDWSKYNGLFNWTLHYRKDADLVGSYGRFERLDTVGNQSAKNQSSEKNARNFFAEKTGMVAWMSSNCVDDARRQRVVHELARYIQVDTYGGCGDNKATGCSDHQCSKHLDKYRFFLSLENANCRDYFTEKLYHAYDRDQIPITNNDAHSSGVAPNGSCIQISDFSSLEHLAKHLKKLASNATAYNSYLSWRKTHRVLTYAAPMCELCKRLHDGSKPAQVYADLYGWLANDSCQPWS